MVSEDTVKAVEAAIAAHVADEHGDASAVVDWFIGYGALAHDDGDLANVNGYLASESSAHGAYGAGRFGLAMLERDVMDD